MTASVPPSSNANHMGYSNANPSAYHRPASSGDWSELTDRIEEAVQDGRLTQSQANQILTHLAQKHNMNG
jgi:hypothetical protein